MTTIKNLPNPKWLTLEQCITERAKLKESGKTIVLTNGCFDLLHPGHLSYLKQAATLGDELWIGLNSDASTSGLKGPTRPVMNEYERAYMLAGLECVSRLFVFNEPRLTKEILAIKPDIYVKAGDYTIETLNQEERSALEKVGAKIKFLPFLEGYSTTKLIKKISDAAHTF